MEADLLSKLEGMWD